jgi:small subunit ribosomal protein S1
MVNRNLLRSLEQDEDFDTILAEALGDADPSEIDWGGGAFAVNQIVEGKVLRIEGDFVLVDVGYKSEGIIPTNEWGEGEDLPEPGQVLRVLIEEVEEAESLGLEEPTGMISLSKRKAEKIQAWIDVMETVHEGDVVTGAVER